MLLRGCRGPGSHHLGSVFLSRCLAGPTKKSHLLFVIVVLTGMPGAQSGQDAISAQDGFIGSAFQDGLLDGHRNVQNLVL